ncbi:alkaline phosphatase family protein [Pistricoccus aurantiacus]|uniref:Alkaline phosphatase family protein n=1 Tax=Pistricoccus aurantiacus TaxID=1883414 RepID=A0A5B8SSJ3_9GAMM|nr:alkaline phosphatase D family protein [Pistricoccus aurantiacus]QEA39234.1 alkaline phosphatase family protein [Pistricoccus aurantiacus]
MSFDHASLPAVLAGPILRRSDPERILLWLVGSRPLSLELVLSPQDDSMPRHHVLSADNCRVLPLGKHAYLHLIDVQFDRPLPQDVRIDYDLRLKGETDQGIADWAPHLLYEGAALPGFVIASRLHSLLHGSCRKPHHPGRDGLVRADSWLAERWAEPDKRPAWLLMTGDQIYADDVAGPMLVAIHALIRRLGLFDEILEDAMVADSQALFASSDTYYHRERLLPDIVSNEALRERLFGGVRKPIFTTASAQNHLITFAEVLAMYLLVWSPVPWRLIEVKPPDLDEKHAKRFDEEAVIIEDFVKNLPQVARLLANQPSLMIFDDHDVTDDWNLNAAWEEVAYEHPFSRRILGNALLAYLLCQGWGNDPDRLAMPMSEITSLLSAAHAQDALPDLEQDAAIRELLRFQGWEYVVPGHPKLVVLDTRTRRWRSERKRHRPSGLMDWEALSDLQQELLDEPAVVVVSPTPMFGVKLIESVQKLFALAGKPLMVDAENWMAHRGAASVMLNIFRHSRTPANYVILSGDVHYSFVYRIRIRDRRHGPNIWQITSSGVKNAFPDTLLDWFDRLNRWLYAPWSPLNFFTKRREMYVTPSTPDRGKAGERLWNGSGIGYVTLDGEGRPQAITELDARNLDVHFPLEEPGEERLEISSDKKRGWHPRGGP